MNKTDLHNINWDIITDILNESASESQIREFNIWISAKKANSESFEQIKSIWIKTGNISHLHSEETNRAWELVKSETILKERKTISIKHKILLPLSIAASLLIALFAWKNVFNLKEIYISTTNNTSLAYNLPDKSQIDLSYNSKITFNKKYGKKNREIWLNGEAFFDVKKDSKKPFIIHTTHGSFQVLGTSFNISSYDKDELLSLYVKTGIVEFFPKARKGSLKIGKGYQIHFNKTDLTVVKEQLKTENYIAWKTGSLSFLNTNLADVAKILETTFNTKIFFDDKELGKLSFTANFKNQSLEKIIKVISITFDLEADYNNERITLKKKETPSN